MKMQEGLKNGDGSQSPSSKSASSRWKSVISRTHSFAKIRDSVIWIGEQAQMQFHDPNIEAHSIYENALGLRPGSSIPSIIEQSFCFLSYNSFDNVTPSLRQTIRFQVIIWNISCPDVKNNQVFMRFCITLFWNDDSPKKEVTTESLPPNMDDERGDNVTMSMRKRSQPIWVMVGRSTAIKKKISNTPNNTINVPPVSILNANSFEVIGQP